MDNLSLHRFAVQYFFAVELKKPCPITLVSGKTSIVIVGMGVERGVAGGGQGPTLDFEIISKKRLFFQFRGVKSKFHHIWPPWKKSFRRP